MDGGFARAEGLCVGIGALSSAFGWGEAGRLDCPEGDAIWTVPGLLPSAF